MGMVLFNAEIPPKKVKTEAIVENIYPTFPLYENNTPAKKSKIAIKIKLTYPLPAQFLVKLIKALQAKYFC